MIHDPILHRVAQLPGRDRARVEFHDMDCGCPACEPYRPSVAPRLTAGDIGRVGLAGLATGVLAAIALDPAHAVRSLLAIVGIGL